MINTRQKIAVADALLLAAVTAGTARATWQHMLPRRDHKGALPCAEH